MRDRERDDNDDPDSEEAEREAVRRKWLILLGLSGQDAAEFTRVFDKLTGD